MTMQIRVLNDDGTAFSEVELNHAEEDMVIHQVLYVYAEKMRDEAKTFDDISRGLVLGHPVGVNTEVARRLHDQFIEQADWADKLRLRLVNETGT